MLGNTPLNSGWSLLIRSRLLRSIKEQIDERFDVGSHSLSGSATSLGQFVWMTCVDHSLTQTLKAKSVYVRIFGNHYLGNGSNGGRAERGQKMFLPELLVFLAGMSSIQSLQ